MISVIVISKDEPALDGTLRDVCAQARRLAEPAEVLVVDASAGRLDAIRQKHAGVCWIDFQPPRGVRISIPHQRNAGVAAATGDIIVFTDAGCTPHSEWLERLTAPLRAGEDDVAAGRTTSSDGDAPYDTHRTLIAGTAYLTECPTINLAFRRAAFDAVHGFDERFEYGSDVDFSWRLVDAGYRIRAVTDAVIAHDWGSRRRQFKRWYAYGQARARLYRKHARRLPRALRDDPVAIAYPLFILGLPLAIRYRWYPVLLIVPAIRNRHNGPLRSVVDHLVFGLGVLREISRP